MARFVTFFAVVALAVGVAFFLRAEDESLKGEIQVITSNDVLEKYLTRYKTVIGADYDGYRNHLYRVLSFTKHFLKGDEKFLEIIAAALVYHDIGLWTNNELAYLDPSAALAAKDLKNDFKKGELDLIHNIIVYHHKLTPFIEGENAQIVEAVRKADTLDFTLGLVNFGMPSAHVSKVQTTLPNAGFHKALAEFGPKLYGWDVVKIVKGAASLFKW
eukprot:TRINITY_DN2130_c0_g1_i4.p1 TRINITY_DN2130_c0_g1~~TRINITY_DN2130_c0_g1_i4.p1  ORF type:complete len:237 (-),score=68.14 TRINITY_DN2130_c0_g1_i4:47-694(-)